MPRERILSPCGRVRLYDVHPLAQATPGWKLRTPPDSLAVPNMPGWQRRTAWRPNLILYEWATIVGKLLTTGAQEYRISAMYLEYQNMADPDDPVDAPTLSRDATQGIQYYDALADSSDRDYLRVGMTAAQLTSTNETNFPGGNDCRFFAMSQGVAGVHGKGFSAGDNSKLFGAALVAIVDEDDPTQDLLLSRFYFDTAEQQVKQDNMQLGVEWSIALQ